MKIKTALVTGGAGFIGSHMVDCLIQSGFKVRAVDNLICGREENIIHHKNHFYTKIENQHTNPNITEIYGALFLATNSNPILRDTYANYGVSHLVAISGFHLGIISIIIFWISSILYKPIQKRYFPWKSKRSSRRG